MPLQILLRREEPRREVLSATAPPAPRNTGRMRLRRSGRRSAARAASLVCALLAFCVPAAAAPGAGGEPRLAQAGSSDPNRPAASGSPGKPGSLTGSILRDSLSDDPERPRITRIMVVGNTRLTQDALLHLMESSEGDPYDEVKLREDFKRIWDRGLLKDLWIESRNDEGGKAIIIHIEEKAIINDALKEREATVEIGEPLDLDVIKKAEETIKGLLGQKGYLDGTAAAEMKEGLSPGSLNVHFDIEEGPRTRIKKIEFTGNTVYSDRRLKKSLKLTKEKGLFTRMSGKDIYHPLKFDQDIREIEALYQNAGYIDLELKPPNVQVVEERKSEKPGKSRKWVHVTQPLVEGTQYRTGKIDVSGNTVFTMEQIRGRIPLREGQILNNALLQAGLDAVEADYGRKGYLYISTNRIINRRPDGVADITIRVSEDKPYRIDRIEFTGNTVTRDMVLRREMQVNEEDLLDLQRLRLGLRRVNQLGYFQVQQEPKIEPIEGTDKVKVTIEGIEQRRSELQIGGGQTRNFLGRGDLVSFNAQTGRLSTRYVFSFTEPYFMGKPVILGVSLFRRTTDYVDFDTDASGGSFTLGRRFRVFHSISTSYLFEDTNFDPVTGLSSDTKTSSLRPGYLFDTRNNPFRPSRGTHARATLEYAGGALGGDNYFIKTVAEITRYIRSWKRTYWAFHGEAGYVGSFGDRFLPTFERFFLGGERSLRIFETRRISPDGFINAFIGDEIFFTKEACLDAPIPAGNRHQRNINRCDRVRIGGNKMTLFNAEYVFPTRGPVDFALFLDAGNAFTEEDRISLSDFKKDAGFEMRFYLPIFGAPIRLIYGFNLDPEPGEDDKTFVFSIGTTF
jgi:outer membrane protein insertion porin family